MKHTFLVIVNADLTANDIKGLICNDASISSDKVEVVEIELVPQGPQPDVVVKNLNIQIDPTLEEQLISR